MIYGSCSIHLKNLTQEQNEALQILSKLSCNIYNLALKEVTDYYAERNKLPQLNDIILRIRHTPEYKATSGKLYLAIIQAIDDYKGYLSTKKYITNKNESLIDRKGLSNFHPPMPKSGMMPIRVDMYNVFGAMINIPATKVTPNIVLTIPADYGKLSICAVSVCPYCSFKVWEVRLSYPLPEIKKEPTDKSLGIDLGVSNFATCATTDGDSFILDGRYLKGIVQGYHKYSIKLKQADGSYTKRLASLHRKSKTRIQDYITKCAAYIVKYCNAHDITNVVLGWGLHMKYHEIGKNTLLFHFFPYGKFATALEHQCRKNGLRFRCVDESFTSKASFLDGDKMPATITRAAQTFSGKRRYRGMYKTKEKILLNADVNAAFNILKKSNAITVEQFDNICSRGIAQPKRIRPV